MKQFLLLPLVAVLSLCAYSQTTAIAAGKKMPAIVFEKLYNAGTSRIELSKISNKVVMVEFWNTRCGTCLKQVPKLAALQKKFKHDLLVVLVTSEDKEVVERYFDKRPELKSLGLPVAYGETQLENLVELPYVPYIGWIGKDKIFKGFTGAVDVTEENIQLLAGGKNIVINTKKQTKILDNEPLLNSVPDHINKIRYSSTLYDSIPKNGTRIRKQPIDDETNQLIFINTSVYRLYAYAYSHDINFNGRPDQRILNESKRIKGETMYCYELIYPGKVYDELSAFKMLKVEMDRAFGINSEIKKLRRAVFVIRIIDSSLLKHPKGRENIKHVDFVEFNDINIASLEGYLGYKKLIGLPVIYMGDINRRISIQLKRDYESFEAMKYDLNQNGIDIVKEEREIDWLVLTDKKE